MGFEQMYPVQASTIPLFMQHKDVVVEVRELELPSQTDEATLTLALLAGCDWLGQDTCIRRTCAGEAAQARQAFGQARNRGDCDSTDSVGPSRSLATGLNQLTDSFG
jgi:hypothetical protein